MSKLPAVKSPFPLCSGEIATAGFLSKSEKHFHCMASLTRSTFIRSTLRAAWFFVVSLRGPQNISNFWGEEEVRLLYTKRVLLVATSHFRRSVALFRKAAVRLLAGRVVRHTRICLGACSQAKTWRHKYRSVTTGCRFFDYSFLINS